MQNYASSLSYLTLRYNKLLPRGTISSVKLYLGSVLHANYTLKDTILHVVAICYNVKSGTISLQSDKFKDIVLHLIFKENFFFYQNLPGGTTPESELF